jgi:hypothetical protein
MAKTKQQRIEEFEDKLIDLVMDFGDLPHEKLVAGLAHQIYIVGRCAESWQRENPTKRPKGSAASAGK